MSSSAPNGVSPGENDAHLRTMMRAAGAGMSLVLPNLYVGSLVDAIDEKCLQKCKVKYMVTVLSEEILAQTNYSTRLADVCAALNIERRILNLADRSDSNVIPHISETNDFIHAARMQRESVLVHCFMGCSRSAALAVAYMMSSSDCNYWDCMDALTAARRGADPNFGFRMQLRRFEHKLLEPERQRLQAKFDAEGVTLRQSDKDFIIEKLTVKAIQVYSLPLRRNNSPT